MYLRGYLNVDIDKSARADLRMGIIEFLSVERAKNSKYDSFLLLHVLSYFTYLEQLNILENIFNLLNPRGVIYIEQPDLTRILELPRNELFLDTLFATSKGAPTHNTTYKCILSCGELKETLHEIGFEEPLISSPLFHGMKNYRDSAILACK